MFLTINFYGSILLLIKLIIFIYDINVITSNILMFYFKNNAVKKIKSVNNKIIISFNKFLFYLTFYF